MRPALWPAGMMSLQATPSRIDREFLAECAHVPRREIMSPLESVGNLGS
jgi:hypothetical protein